MKHTTALKRIISLLLALVMTLGLVSPAWALESPDGGLTWEQVENDSFPARLPLRNGAEESAAQPAYADSDAVRVSIVLEDASTIAGGFTAGEIASGSAGALQYRAELARQQEELSDLISRKALGGEALDVQWNLTLAANIISANVPYGRIGAIEQLPGVASVLIETRYEPCTTTDEAADPQMATSSEQIGSDIAWANGYTGAGSVVAVIDTGVDADHPLLDGSAYGYAVSGMKIDTLTTADVADKLPQLNAAQFGLTAESAHVSAKIPYGFNYIDHDTYITHEQDAQGDHGSHVSGIAVANRYCKDAYGRFVPSLKAVNTQGVAPDAQLLVMKVFGRDGGAYDSDYMAALEDAMVLGADVANLSLGTGNPGYSREATQEYQSILDDIADSGMVVAISAGNSGTWQESSTPGALYADGVSYATNGSPGSYTNSLCVASVDNAGSTAHALDFGGKLSAVPFTEVCDYGNASILSLDTSGSGTAYDFVLFDSTGVDAGGNNLLADYADLVAGKIVLVQRGDSPFYEKHSAVGQLGGAACVVMNTQSGSIRIDLTGSTATIPCVSITRADSRAIRDAATPVTDDGGNVLYYTGKVTISSAVKVVQNRSGYYTMSSFSSWGVPGSLELKPEITAPGGNIYSLRDGGTYQNMSGTSMASPQVAGMAAVVAQYIHDNDLAAKTGLSPRQLAQSLLMSTAQPLREEKNGGEYYSVLTQGAGLANVGAAVTSGSYIRMDAGSSVGAPDGKIKVELGEDAGRSGSYTMGFTLYNLSNTPASFCLSADFFTQLVYTDGSGIDWQDTATAPLASTLSWTVDDTVLESSISNALRSCDFSGDGKLNGADAQALLDYVTGARESIHALSRADQDGDGDIDTYDVYCFLRELNANTVELPAGGSVHITLRAQVLGLEICDHDGAYVEGFVYASELTTDEGELGDSHSIPVLGYYGSWTEPSMFDVGSYLAYQYGEETRSPYLYDANGSSNSYQSLTIRYNGDSTRYYFGGNPYGMDSFHDPDRDAINPDTTVFADLNYSLIRNAEGLRLRITGQDGTVYYTRELPRSGGAFFYTNAGEWYDSRSRHSFDYIPDVADGTRLTLSVTAAPEYYASYDPDGTPRIDWDALSDGATQSYTAWADRTAPTLQSVSLSDDASRMTVRAADNCYIAAIALYDYDSGTRMVQTGGHPQGAARGSALTAQLDLSGYTGYASVSHLLLQVYDYAGNLTTYKLNRNTEELSGDVAVTLSQSQLTIYRKTTARLTAEVSPFGVSPDTVTWTSSNDKVATVSDGLVTGIAAGTATVTATSVKDPSSSASCAVTVEDPSYRITGIRQGPDGVARLFRWSADTESDWNAYAQLEHTLVSATCDSDSGTIYQMDGSGYLHQVNRNTGATVTTSAAGSGFGAPMYDIAYGTASAQETGAAVLFGVYGSYFLYSSPAMDNSFAYGWNLTSYLSQYLGASALRAVAWVGQSTNSSGHTVDVLYCLTDTGDIWIMSPDVQTGSAGLSYIRSDLELTFHSINGGYGCSMVMDEDGTLYLSHYNGSTSDIYALRLRTITNGDGQQEEIYSAVRIASMDDGAGTCALLEVTSGQSAASRSLPAEPLAVAEVQTLSLPEREPTGGLNAAPARSQEEQEPTSGSTATLSEDESVLTVALAPSQPAHNGLFTLSYDPAALTLRSVSIGAEYASWYDGGGTVTLGFADRSVHPEGSPLTELIFDVRPDSSATELTLLATERECGAQSTGIEQTFTLTRTLPAQTIASGTCGENLTWTLDDEGTLTISGTGAMEDYITDFGAERDTPWQAYRNSIKAVVVQPGVTTIGVNAFSGCDSLSSVSLSESVTTIGKWAFYSCDNLSGITVGSGLTSIGAYAFGGTAYYNNAGNWTDALLYLDAYLIDAKRDITSAVIRSGTKILADDAFSGCDSLSSVRLPDSLTAIGNSAFGGCTSLSNVRLPDSLTAIGNSAFGGCSSLSSINIPGSVITIGEFAFYGCSSLTAIHVSAENSSYVSDSGVLLNKDKTRLLCCPGGFSGSYAVPNGVVTIDDSAFFGCSGLTAIYVSAENSSYASDSGVLFNKDKTLLLCCPGGFSGSYAVPDTVVTIDDYAFSGCSGLTDVTIPNGVASINNFAFSECSSLSSVSFPERITNIGHGAFYKCASLTSVSLPEGITAINSNTFYECTSLTDISIPNGVTSIEFQAFLSCASLTSIKLPWGFDRIAGLAFMCCGSLTSITIPDSVTVIGDWAFDCCGSLSDIYYGGTEAQWSEIWIGGDNTAIHSAPVHYNWVEFIASGTCGENLTWTLDDEGTLTISGTGAMENYRSGAPWQAYHEQIRALVIEEGVTTIGDSAFFDCDSLSSLTLPDSLTHIGEAAFYSCGGLTDITLPDGVKSLGVYAFSTCRQLQRVTLSSGLATIAGGAFYDCGSLSAITLPNTVTAIGDNAFGWCRQLQSVTLNSGLTVIGSAAFYACSSLTAVDLPASVAQIGQDAFGDCGSLTAIRVAAGSVHYASDSSGVLYSADMTRLICCPGGFRGSYTAAEGATRIEKSAFSGCAGLQSVTLPHGLSDIGDMAFFSCGNLTELHLPESLCSVGNRAFAYCDSLADVYFAGSPAQWSAVTVDEGNEPLREATVHIAKPDAPGLSSAIVTSTGKIRLSWNAVDNAVKYYIYRCTDGNNYKYYDSTKNTSYTNSSVTPGTTYYYKVVAVSGGGAKSAYSNRTYRTADCAKPSLSSSNVSTGGIKLSWNAVDGAAKYYIYRSTDGGKNYSFYDSTKNTTYTNKSVTPGNSYYYKIKAICANTNGNSAYSNVANRTADCVAPKISSSNVSTGGIKLTWSAVEGASKYYIYRSTDGGKTYSRYDTTTSTSYTNKSVTPGKTYYYKLVAVCGKSSYGDSAYSNVASRTADCVTPTLSIQLSSGGKPQLTWSAIDGASKYYIYRSTDGENFSFFDSTTKTSYTNTGAKSGTTYYYKVVAICKLSSYGNSAYSNTVSIKSK